VFQEERWKLGPKYDCQLCDLSEKDLAKGCPKCPLTHLFNDAYKEAARDEIEYRGGMPEGYTLEGLMALHSTVSGILGDNDDKIDPDWTVSFTELARIILERRAHHKFGNDWNDWRRMMATAKK
jgi:hypothetical protein